MQRYTILTVNNRSLELQVTTANVVSLGIERQNIEAFVLQNTNGAIFDFPPSIKNVRHIHFLTQNGSRNFFGPKTSSGKHTE